MNMSLALNNECMCLCMVFVCFIVWKLSTYETITLLPQMRNFMIITLMINYIYIKRIRYTAMLKGIGKLSLICKHLYLAKVLYSG